MFLKKARDIRTDKETLPDLHPFEVALFCVLGNEGGLDLMSVDLNTSLAVICIIVGRSSSRMRSPGSSGDLEYSSLPVWRKVGAKAWCRHGASSSPASHVDHVLRMSGVTTPASFYTGVVCDHPDIGVGADFRQFTARPLRWSKVKLL